MFTGIVEEVGEIKKIERRSGLILIEIEGERVIHDLRVGDSISVEGVCLTVSEKRNDRFSVNVSEETRKRTTLGCVKERDKVNLERALKIGDRLGGHFVQGHVDGLVRIVKREKVGGQVNMGLEVPETLSPYLVEKGSVAISGVSLTVVKIFKGNIFSTVLIPYTLLHTTLGLRKTGELLNIEVDIIGKYVYKREVFTFDENRLKEYGF